MSSGALDSDARDLALTAGAGVAIIALGPALDANYEAVKADAYVWPNSDGSE